MALQSAIWKLNATNNSLYNINANNNYYKALNEDNDFPNTLWFLNGLNLKNNFTKDNLQKAMTEDLDYPIELWFLGSETNLKMGKTKDTLQKAMTRRDMQNNVITYPKQLWYLEDLDDRLYLKTECHTIPPFKCMTNMDTYVKTYPKVLWQAPNWEYYDYTLIHPICPNYELMGAFCHAKNITELSIKNDVSFGDFSARESNIEIVKVNKNANINYKTYTFKEGTEIIKE